ncbi:MAG: hypothetical protein PHP05_06360 [Sideroxydans sp.]|nr:hypothetical protein [Sideroxydans sp.]
MNNYPTKNRGLSPINNYSLTLYLTRLLILAAAIFSITQDAVAQEAYGISNYHPSDFVESAASPFFYSIGKQLKYGTGINESAPSLFEGSWLNGKLVAVYPSPDNQKAAIVSNRRLYIARVGEAPLLALENVDHYNPNTMNDGDVYFKWPTLQWHPNSRFIYIAKDKKKKIWEQTFSKDAILVRIDTENNGVTEELIADFPSNNYFFVGSDSVCFNYAFGDGSVIWKCSTANGVYRARSLSSIGVQLDNEVVLTEQRFLSYRPDLYESRIWAACYGFIIREINERQEALFHKDAQSSPLLIFNYSKGRGIKDHSATGFHRIGGSVLPGGRYLLLDMGGNSSEGQILVDRMSRHYRKLPKDTRVYRNLNSTHFDDFVFSIDPVSANSFKPNTECFPDSNSRTKSK